MGRFIQYFGEWDNWNMGLSQKKVKGIKKDLCILCGILMEDG